MNFSKTVVINIVNLSLFALIFYISFGFCAVWINWAHTLLYIWLICLVVDFIIMEIFVELLILVFYTFRNSSILLKGLFRCIIELKNVRNF